MSVNFTITEEERTNSLIWMLLFAPEAFANKEYYHHLGILQEYKNVNDRHLLKTDILFPKLVSIDDMFVFKVEEIKKQTYFLVNVTRERVLDGDLNISEIEFEYKFSLFSKEKYQHNDFLSCEPFFVFYRHKRFPIKYDLESFDFEMDEDKDDKYFNEDSSKFFDGLLIGDKFLGGSKKVSNLLLYLHEDTYLSYYDIADIETIEVELKMIYYLND